MYVQLTIFSLEIAYALYTEWSVSLIGCLLCVECAIIGSGTGVSCDMTYATSSSESVLAASQLLQAAN